MGRTVYTSVEKLREKVKEAGWIIPDKVWDKVSSSVNKEAKDYEYEWDDRPIYYFMFTNVEEDDGHGRWTGEYTLLEVKRDLWDDMCDRGSCRACGGCLIDNYRNGRKRVPRSCSSKRESKKLDRKGSRVHPKPVDISREYIEKAIQGVMNYIWTWEDVERLNDSVVSHPSDYDVLLYNAFFAQ